MNSSNPIVPDSVDLIGSFLADKLNVRVYQSAARMEIAAASSVTAEIRRLITARGRAIGIFSGEVSQAELLDQLAKADVIEWTRVIGFHTAELLGADEDHPQSQRKFLLDHFVRRVPMAEFHGIRGEAANPEAVCVNYSALLKSRPPDFAVLGIGLSGELAAIDSGNCDFNDSSTVKLTDSAITLTIKTLMDCRSLFVIAGGEEKRQAIQSVIEGEISADCPASILRKHPNAHLFLDRAAANQIKPENL